jgi:hypothetical protein
MRAFDVIRPRRVVGMVSALMAMTAWLTGCGPSKPPPPEIRESPPAPVPSVSANARFEEVTERAGLRFTHQLADGKLSNIMESDGAGGCVLDFDGDGFMDVYLVNSGPAPVLSDAPSETIREPNRLFRNRGDGTFEDATERAGVAGRGFGTTAVAADYDNDGDADLLAVNFDGVILFENQGDGTFRDKTADAGIASTNAAISATFFDADGDGFLDLFIANYLVFDPAVTPPAGSPAPYAGPLAYAPEFNQLHRNRGNGTFEDISLQAGIRIDGHRAMSVAPIDYDLDGDTDLYVSNDGTANLLLANDGKGHFTDVALRSGVAFNQFGEAAGSMGAAVGDVNGDGLPDMFVTRFGLTSLYLNSPGGLFEDRVGPAGLLNVTRDFTGWGGNLLDFDNDGDPDLFIVNGDAHFLRGMTSLLFENDGNAVFRSVGHTAGQFFRQEINGRGSGVIDFDNDGRCDLVVTTLGGPAHLLHNRTPSSRRWITLRFEGVRSNRAGFGALVTVRTAARSFVAEVRCPTSYVFQSETSLHFGLGDSTLVERIEVRWPSGVTQTLTDVGVDQILKIREPGELRWR